MTVKYDLGKIERAIVRAVINEKIEEFKGLINEYSATLAVANGLGIDLEYFEVA